MAIKFQLILTTESSFLEDTSGGNLRPHLHLSGESAMICEMPSVLLGVGEVALIYARHMPLLGQNILGKGVIMAGNFR